MSTKPHFNFYRRIFFWRLTLGVYGLLMFHVSNAQPVVSSNLIAYYPFDTNATDSTLSGRDGVVYNASECSDRFGTVNSAYLLTHAQDSIVIPSPFTNATNDFTISFWFSSSKLDKTTLLSLGDRHTESEFITFVLNDNSGCNVYINDNSTYKMYAGYANEFSDGYWHHVVLTRKNDRIKFFLDNKAIDSILFNDPIQPTSPIKIGVDTSTLDYNGRFDELLIYDAALDSIDLRKSYYRGHLWLNHTYYEEAWLINNLKYISWKASDSIDYIKLEYSEDQGNNWNTIADQIDPKSERYGWYLPNHKSDHVIIRLSDLSSNTSITPRLSKPFSISPYYWNDVTTNARFSPRDGAGALVLNDRLWLIGGWNDNLPQQYPKASNRDMWSSYNGIDWEFITKAPWEVRHYAGYCVHKKKMWIVGGDTNQGHYQKDVWSSSNGIEWEKISANAPWGKRVTHYVTAYNNKIWVMGGQQISFAGIEADTAFNDVWNSPDGKNWTRVLDKAPWSPRGQMGQGIVFQDKMWIIGGGTYEAPRTYYNDVWNTSDGINWNLVTDQAPWQARQYHNLMVYDNKIWIIGGYDGIGNMGDIWFSSDGIAWTQLMNAPWPARHAASVYEFNNSLWLVAGNLWNDIWQLVNTENPPLEIKKPQVPPDTSLTKTTEPFILYPNPTRNILSISQGTKQQYTLSLYDTLGKLWHKKESDELNSKLDVSNLPKGLYIVKIIAESSESSYTYKITIE